MEKKFSLDEVNSLIAKFKNKKKPKIISPSPPEQPSMSITTNHQENEDLFGSLQNNNIDDIFNKQQQGENQINATTPVLTDNSYTPQTNIINETLTQNVHNNSNEILVNQIQETSSQVVLEDTNVNMIFENPLNNEGNIDSHSPNKEVDDIFQHQQPESTIINNKHSKQIQKPIISPPKWITKPIIPTIPKKEENNIFPKQLLSNITHNTPQINQQSTSTTVKNIYQTFSNEFKAKPTVFGSDSLTQEIDKLDEDYNSSPEQPKKETIITSNIITQQNLVNQPSLPMTNRIPQSFPTESILQLSMNINSCKPLFINGNIISSSYNNINIIPLHSYSNEINSMLDKEYFPSTYSQNYDYNTQLNLLQSYINYCHQITNRHNSINSYIVIYLEYLLLQALQKHQRTFSIFSKDNSSSKLSLIHYIQQFLSINNKSTISLNLNLQSSPISYDICNSSLEQLISQCKQNVTCESLLLLSIIGSKQDISDIIHSILLQGEIKEDNIYLYLYNLISSSNDLLLNQIGTKEADLIFKHFPVFILLILELFTTSNEPVIKNLMNKLLLLKSYKKNFLHYVILTFLTGDFNINNENEYALMFTSYLNHPSLEKIFIADVFTYIMFCFNDKLPEIIRNSSILLKFKYVQLKLHTRHNDFKVNDLGNKIHENIAQFGNYSNNTTFKEYFNTLFPLAKSNETIYKSASSKNNTNNRVNTVPNESNQNKEVKQNKGGGFFSYVSSALGIGGKGNNDNKQQQTQQRVYTEEEKRMMTEEERWAIEHPGEPEYYYDKTLRRYVLRGKIYDDQEEVVQKKKMQEPVKAPPKAKNIIKPKTQEDNLYDNSSNKNIQSNPQIINNNIGGNQQINNNNINGNQQTTKVNNPFGIRKPPPPIQRKVQGPQTSSLTGRYAVAYQK